MTKANWNYPTAIKFGPGRIAELPDALKTAGISRPLLVTDAGLVNLPVTQNTIALLKAAGFAVGVFADVKPNPISANVEAGIKVLREAAETWGRMAAEAVDVRGLDAVLYAGDDNVDERRGVGSGTGQWEFMLRQATGLTQVQAPTGTHGSARPLPNGRRIDDFRQRGLRRRGPGHVFDTPSDHHAFVQDFIYRRLRPGATLPR